jgi:hypothetical protein
MAQATARRGQYRQAGRENTPNFAITDREVAILQHLAEHRVLDSDHLTELLAPYSDQTTRRRLSLLYHAGFLWRPREHLKYRASAGSPPMAYELHRRGVELLLAPERFGVPPELVANIPEHTLRWVAKKSDITTKFLEHSLLVADVMVALERACTARGDIRLIRPSEILEAVAPEATRALERPFYWTADVAWNGWRGTVGVVPDKVFGLEFVHEPPPNRVWFFLEADKGTETVLPARATLKRSSFLQKAAAYHATWQQKLHTERFGLKNFRVLTVTTTPPLMAPQVKKEIRRAGEIDRTTARRMQRRVELLVEANRKVTEGRGSGLFLFTDLPSLLVAGDILAMPLTTGTGKTVRLTD